MFEDEEGGNAWVVTFADIMIDNTDLAESVELAYHGDKIVLQIDGRYLFESGQDRLNSRSVPGLFLPTWGRCFVITPIIVLPSGVIRITAISKPRSIHQTGNFQRCEQPRC